MSVDLYFDDNYGSLYEKIEQGTAQIFTLTTKNGRVKNMFIKRKSPSVNNEEYFEIISPYGYGGAVIEELTGDKAELEKEYEQAFSKYCKEQNIVCEFVRFHPIVNNALDFKNVYSPIYSRKTLGTNLADFEDPIAAEFSKSCRKSVRQAFNKGVSWRVTPSPTAEQFSVFKEIYYSTMDRKDASDYYYFEDTYFADCLNYFKDNIILVEALFEEKTIAAGFYFTYKKTIHAHLSGTLSEYLHLSPAYALKAATAIWGKENGYELIHYGGGVSSSTDDALFQFKKKFAQNTEFDFYIAKKIWDNDAYFKICKAKNTDPNADFFPAWRSR